MPPTICLLLLSTAAWSPPSASGPGQALHARLSLDALLLDYGLPGHPKVSGQSHLGMLARASLQWAFDLHFELEAGVLGRLPFSLNPEEEAGALPILAFTIRPWGEAVLARFGSLEAQHDYHPSLVDEARHRYGRDLEETYSQSLAGDLRRDLGRDLFMPGEHGAQIVAIFGAAHAEGFLDWQLLETPENREKFAVGALGELSLPRADFGFQFRLVHYGGERFTRSDPLRSAGIDAARQPTSLALVTRLRPIVFGPIMIELPAALIGGRLAQERGAGDAWRRGVELGGDVWLFSDSGAERSARGAFIARVEPLAFRVGYRLWLPEGNRAGFVSEDGDPVYSGPRSHRAGVEISSRHGIVTVSGKLDLVFPNGGNDIQYLAVTRATFIWGQLISEDPVFP